MPQVLFFFIYEANINLIAYFIIYMQTYIHMYVYIRTK